MVALVGALSAQKVVKSALPDKFVDFCSNVPLTMRFK